ncbi:MAG: hypothetical protein EOO43_00090 [Flavobacterium sp.]|nr:MAG: hypothetical protein EOO43_00090 [Flavobacterium sp.]
MEEFGTDTRKLQLTADLKTIIKYHPASKLYLNDTTTETYTSTAKVKLVAKKGADGKFSNPVSDYDLDTVILKALPKPYSNEFRDEHEANLLVLVKNLIQFEWEYFETFYKTNIETKTTSNLHATVTDHLKELKILYSILEEKQTSDVVTKLNLTYIDEFKKRKNVTDKQVISSDEEESKQIIQLLIDNRLRLLMNPEYFYYQFNGIEDLTSKEFELAINRMEEPFKYHRGEFLFTKYIAQVITDYLKNEINWGTLYIGISEAQASIIYTLLLVFNILNPNEYEYERSDRDKAIYIRSLFRNDLKNNGEQFFKFTDVINFQL